MAGWWLLWRAVAGACECDHVDSLGLQGMSSTPTARGPPPGKMQRTASVARGVGAGCGSLRACRLVCALVQRLGIAPFVSAACTLFVAAYCAHKVAARTPHRLTACLRDGLLSSFFLFLFLCMCNSHFSHSFLTFLHRNFVSFKRISNNSGTYVFHQNSFLT